MRPATPQALRGSEAARWRIGLPAESQLARALLYLILFGLLIFLLGPLFAILSHAVLDKQGNFAGLTNFITYLQTPSLVQSAWNTLWVSLVVALVAVPAAFIFAFALTRSCMPLWLKASFRLIALIPLLAPSLLSAISFVQWFGNQGLLKPLLLGGSIYGAPGIILAQVYNTFPHALLILITALSLADGRLYEAANALGARGFRQFLTITLPACKYGLISATTVVFTYVVADFGAPKVIGGNFNVLALDVFKQVIGQQNFSMGAVVSLLLLLPSVLSFIIDVVVRKKIRAQLTARSVPASPKPDALADRLLTLYCLVISVLLLAVIGMALYTSLIKLWPYNLTLTLDHYRFILFDSEAGKSFLNSVTMSLWTAAFGACTVFVGAYLIEKTPKLGLLRPLMHFLAVLSMAVPGLVLGLGYVVFFNHPANPFNPLYQTMAIVVISTIVHYYTSGHLTAMTALKQLDNDFEAISSSLKVPFYKTFWRVTVPVCLPAILDIARYYFVVSMTTLSCIIFIYTPETIPAAIEILHLDEAGEIGPASGLACLIVGASVLICVGYSLCTRVLLNRTQAWRNFAKH
jgi:iron(III) transport system permease protein